ncbi:nucleoside phosphorylase [Amycolatopsis pithecellobii]|uniref:Uridine phosphorylase n=1 Tax=Amycolatopsis pithecellobii TaxID=664692 RepID=A0A6N7Z0N0_9PSEU|nr:nucleoside phosphorylase [Amycolatopsis pithecellobii]MTD53024.1 hypothetical protein [Amycolatopsis pithecellobii]
MTVDEHQAVPAAALAPRFFTALAEDGFTAANALVTGDPGRIEPVSELLTDARVKSFRRGFKGATGHYRGLPVFLLSHGIGAPGIERALIELKELGVRSVIRVGTTGALQEGIEPGTLIVNDAAVRLEGTSLNYARPEFPAAASWDMTAALVEAARARQQTVHVGTGATTSSFFAGQGREPFTKWNAAAAGVLDEMHALGVLNFEMEVATLLTLARIFGVRAGAICTVVNNRVDKVPGWEFSTLDAAQVALDALVEADSAVVR